MILDSAVRKDLFIKCTDDVAFLSLAAEHEPDFRSVLRFRCHLDALAEASTGRRVRNRGSAKSSSVETGHLSPVR
ncbi:hypothetical protein ACFU90_03615 [Streptomyces noursei]|uniref:hypothetical protein n=1 Tax=Streptomyces noursei TaxID=1971 RepID=UPI0033F402DD